MTEKNECESLVKQGLKKSIKSKTDQYKLIFHSKSILFSQAIAEYLFDELKVQKTTTLLLDLNEEEVDEIFNEIVCKKSASLLKNPIRENKFELRRLNEVTKEKRSQLYKTPGVYSVSIQVFIMDLIRFEKIISLNSINRIIIRISQKITTFLNYHGWIFTLLKKQTKNCSVILLCREVQCYTEFESLQGIYRTFFCSKLVIWPFGRSQVHKSFQTVLKKLNEQKHYLEMTEQMKKNEQALKKLLEIVQREYNRFRTHKINGLQVLMKQSVGQQLQEHSAQRYETSDFRKMKFLMNCVQNYDSIHLMTYILSLRNNDTQKSIWNSSNSTVSELFEQIEKNCKSRIFTIEKIQQNQKPIEVDLVELIKNYHYERDEVEIADQYSDWQAIYGLQYRIKPSSQKNHKVLQTFEIIDKILEEIHEKQKILEFEKQESSNKKSSDKILQDIKFEQETVQRLLINCPNETARRYLHKQIFSKVNKSQYIESLRSVYHYLSIQRQLRITCIKSIFNKNKQKKQNQKMEIQSGLVSNNVQIVKIDQNLENQQYLNLPLYQGSQKQEVEKSQSSSQMLQVIDSQMQNRFSDFSDNSKSLNPYKESHKLSERQEQLSLPIKMSNSFDAHEDTVKEKQNPLKVSKKNKKPYKQLIKENISILQQSLYKQLTWFFDILSRYQNQVFTEEQIKMNTSNVKKLVKQTTKEITFVNKKLQKQETKDDSKLMFQVQDDKKINQDKKEKNDKVDSLRDLMKGQTLVFENLFQQQLSRVQFHFIDKKQLSVAPSYSEAAQISFYSKLNTQKKVLIVSLFASKSHSTSSSTPDRVTEFHRAIKLINPHRVIFYSPHSWQTRNLYLSQSQGHLSNLKQVDVLAFKNSFEVASAEHQIKTQDEAFWKISQNRMKLSQYKQNPQMRIKELNLNDKYEKTIDFINYAIKNDPRAQDKPHIYQMGFNDRRVIVDTRQFKSSLPCYLFFCGFTVIPIQLQTADYILSDQIGIQKKSVVTKDLQNSLKTFRIDNQIKRLCQKFQKPYLLIECEETQDFKKQSFYQKGLPTTKGGKDSYRIFVRQRLAQLLKKFPKLRIIWSDSVSRTCEFFKILKKDQAQPQIGKYMKNQNEQNEKAKLFDSSDQQSEKEKQLAKIQQ